MGFSFSKIVFALDTFKFRHFGTVHVSGEQKSPKAVIIFISGDGGWEKGVVDMANMLGERGFLVFGVDLPRYFKARNGGKEKCLYPAGDFEALAQFGERKIGLKNFQHPLLIGYSSGATLVYALLAETTTTFSGGVSLGFCSDIEFKKPFCKGAGLATTPIKTGQNFSPSEKLQVPWIALQGQIDQVCSYQKTKTFVENTHKGTMILLPKVGHGFSVSKNWKNQFLAAVESIVPNEPIKETLKQAAINNIDTTIIEDLPIIELPIESKEETRLAVIYSGDGGWANIDKELAEYINKKNIPVVGMNSLKYFWKEHTPEDAGKDLELILRFYLSSWKKTKVILVGYSLGAETLPFIVEKLGEEMRTVVEKVVLLSPGDFASFEFHISDWADEEYSSQYPVKDVLERLSKTKTNIVCIYGKEDQESSCRKAPKPIKIIELEGGHHFNGEYEILGQLVL